MLYNKDASGNIVGTPYEMLDPGYAEVGQAELPEQRVFLGAWKLLEDGSPQGYTAWMKKPGYYDWDKYTAEDSFNKASYFNGLPGTRYYTSAGLTHAIGIFHKYGQSTETHTNGSGAAEAYVTALENVVAMYPTAPPSMPRRWNASISNVSPEITPGWKTRGICMKSWTEPSPTA